MPPPASGLGSGDRVVALKCPFKEDISKPGRTIRLHPSLELQSIVTEAATWQWSNCLLEKVYEYVWGHPSWNNQEAPNIPMLKFVPLGIAKRVLSGVSGAKSFDGAFLVEERIRADQGFLRFLGNGSAIPCVFQPETPQHRIAQFCAFAQHIQWSVTDGRAFCADWQGKRFTNLLDCILNFLCPILLGFRRSRRVHWQCTLVRPTNDNTPVRRSLRLNH